MRIAHRFTLFAFTALAACTSVPAPTAGSSQNPANPTAAESPRPPFLVASPAPQADNAGAAEHDTHSAGSSTPAPALTAAPLAGIAGAAVVTYTCPMHPEVRSHEPGSCPKCGMTLVPIPDKPERP